MSDNDLRAYAKDRKVKGWAIMKPDTIKKKLLEMGE
jgi:hypothetical protein